MAFHGVVYNKRQVLTSPEVLTFDEIVTNEGEFFSGDADETSASFNIKQNGVYSFHVTSRANGNAATPVELYLNNSTLVMESGRTNEFAVSDFPIGTNQAVMYLEAGDMLTLQIKARPSGTFHNMFTHFTSWSDISFSAFKVA